MLDSFITARYNLLILFLVFEHKLWIRTQNKNKWFYTTANNCSENGNMNVLFLDSFSHFCADNYADCNISREHNNSFAKKTSDPFVDAVSLISQNWIFCKQFFLRFFPQKKKIFNSCRMFKVAKTRTNNRFVLKIYMSSDCFRIKTDSILHRYIS